jgi:HlyD family secretion protein
MNERLSDDIASLKINRDVNPDAKSPWRAPIIALVVVLVLGAVVWFLLGSVKGQLVAKSVEVTQVRLVSPAQASVQVTSTGYVVAQITSKVGSKVLGRVAEVPVKEGVTVKADDILVKLEAAEAKAAYAAAKARFAAARARAETARATLLDTRRQFTREKNLLAEGATARSVVEDLETRVGSLGESLKAAEADAAAQAAGSQELEANLAHLTIRAPISGTVIGKPVDVGQLVGPGTPHVVELADFNSLMVETDVPESRLSLIKPGSPAEVVLDAYPQKRHRGEVAEISLRVNRAKATVVVKVKFVDEAPGVLPDMAARVSFLNQALDKESLQKPPSLVVPASAVTEREGRKVVFTLEDGKARMVPVELGPRAGNGFELVNGPRDGTRVVANPGTDLVEGTSLKEKTP